MKLKNKNYLSSKIFYLINKYFYFNLDKYFKEK